MTDKPVWCQRCASLSALAAGPAGLVTVDAKGVFEKVNDAFCDLLGYSREELLGRSFNAITHPADWEKGSALLKQLIAGGRKSVSIEKRYITKTNQVLDVVLHTTRLVDQHGTIQFLTQVTDRTCAVATARLAKSHAASIKEFADICAHQLKAPQRTILGMAESLREDAADRLTEEEKSYIDFIIMKAEFMQEIIDTVRSLTEISVGAETLVDVDVGEALLEAWSDVAVSRRGKVRIGTGLGSIRGNKTMLVQVFGNIMDNALKFNTTAEPEVVVTTAVEFPIVRMSFTDNGVGMPAHVIERMFSTFYRGNPSFPGHGIGGAVVKSMVEAMSGAIEVVSVEGQGTCVSIDLFMGSVNAWKVSS